MYECHITIEAEEKPTREEIKYAVDIIECWKFSAIDGDPILGPGVKYYATAHFPGEMGVDEVIKRLEATAYYFKTMGAKVVRTKVEIVVYDKKNWRAE